MSTPAVSIDLRTISGAALAGKIADANHSPVPVRFRGTAWGNCWTVSAGRERTPGVVTMFGESDSDLECLPGPLQVVLIDPATATVGSLLKALSPWPMWAGDEDLPAADIRLAEAGSTSPAARISGPSSLDEIEQWAAELLSDPAGHPRIPDPIPWLATIGSLLNAPAGYGRTWRVRRAGVRGPLLDEIAAAVGPTRCWHDYVPDPERAPGTVRFTMSKTPIGAVVDGVSVTLAGLGRHCQDDELLVWLGTDIMNADSCRWARAGFVPPRALVDAASGRGQMREITATYGRLRRTGQQPQVAAEMAALVHEL